MSVSLTSLAGIAIIAAFAAPLWGQTLQCKDSQGKQFEANRVCPAGSQQQGVYVVPKAVESSTGIPPIISSRSWGDTPSEKIIRANIELERIRELAGGCKVEWQVYREARNKCAAFGDTLGQGNRLFQVRSVVEHVDAHPTLPTSVTLEVRSAFFILRQVADYQIAIDEARRSAMYGR